MAAQGRAEAEARYGSLKERKKKKGKEDRREDAEDSGLVVSRQARHSDSTLSGGVPGGEGLVVGLITPHLTASHRTSPHPPASHRISPHLTAPRAQVEKLQALSKQEMGKPARKTPGVDKLLRILVTRCLLTQTLTQT